jgi:hypothetical protein
MMGKSPFILIWKKHINRVGFQREQKPSIINLKTLIIKNMCFLQLFNFSPKIFLDCFDMNEMFFFFATLKKKTDTIL